MSRRPQPSDQTDDDPILREEFNRRFKALEARITELEQQNSALENQLQKFTSVEGEPVESSTPDPDRLQVLNIIESLQDESEGASMEAVKEQAANRNLLRSKTKISVKKLIEECYVEGDVDGRVRVVAWPDEYEDES